MPLVDTNILLDIATSDPDWFDWSRDALDTALLDAPLFVNDVIFAEFSVRYAAVEEVEAFLAAARLTHVPMPREALFLAGKAFASYRRAGGTRTGVLPDFFIGAHAIVDDMPLLTRDPSRYKTYFPTLTVIAP